MACSPHSPDTGAFCTLRVLHPDSLQPLISDAMTCPTCSLKVNDWCMQGLPGQTQLTTGAPAGSLSLPLQKLPAQVASRTGLAPASQTGAEMTLRMLAKVILSSFCQSLAVLLHSMQILKGPCLRDLTSQLLEGTIRKQSEHVQASQSSASTTKRVLRDLCLSVADAELPSAGTSSFCHCTTIPGALSLSEGLTPDCCRRRTIARRYRAPLGQQVCAFEQRRGL